MKKKPTGFIAVCQCGEKIGALDYKRTDQKKAGQIIGAWLADGCIVVPKFESSWSEKISACKCQNE